MKKSELRIIGGKWRGRKIKFSASVHLRPTPNRIRETLFNWLGTVIEGAVCLDLFAGSGALGFEALSRGAKHVTMIDKSSKVIRTLKENAAILGAENIEFICAEFSPQLKNIFSGKFDIVFLDPPFYQNLVAPSAKWLEQQDCLADNAFIYIEMERTGNRPVVPKDWQGYRSKVAGEVRYVLYRR